jgi:hypothetical protein
MDRRKLIHALFTVVLEIVSRTAAAPRPLVVGRTSIVRARSPLIRAQNKAESGQLRLIHAATALFTLCTVLEAAMSNEQKNVRIELTTEQRTLVKEQTGVDVSSVDLTIEELEDRIAPTSFSFGQVQVTYHPQ